MLKSNYLIYKFTSPSGKSYIGQTKKLSTRILVHKNPNSRCRSFSNAIKKYSWEMFTQEILAEHLTLEEANILEEQLIKEHNTLTPNGYNLTTGGLNFSRSEETKILQSINSARRGKLGTMTGKKHTKEVLIKMSINKKGKPGKPSPRKGKQGTPHSVESKQKTSNTMKGIIRTEEFKNKHKGPHPTIQCPHCGKIGGERAMKRHHFNNCKALIKN